MKYRTFTNTMFGAVGLKYHDTLEEATDAVKNKPKTEPGPWSQGRSDPEYAVLQELTDKGWKTIESKQLHVGNGW